MSQTDEAHFRLGENVGATQGAVVFENKFIQLIQYSPLTDKVYKKPLVIVPPCINKFYVLDLQPQNSFVRYAVEQGFTVMMVSWRNPLASDTDGIDTATWDDYLRSEEHTSELQSLMRISYAVFCLKKTTQHITTYNYTHNT